MDRLAEHEVVELSLSGGSGAGRRGEFEARILAFSEQTVALEAVDKSDMLAIPERSDHVLLTALYVGGLLALRGTLTLDAIPGDLRFTPDPNTATKRTRPTRLHYTLPLTATSDGVTHTGLTTAISPTSLSATFEDGWQTLGPTQLTLNFETGKTPIVSAAAILL